MGLLGPVKGAEQGAEQNRSVDIGGGGG